jgi:hypothetical protein
MLNFTQYRDNNNTKGNDVKTEKTGKPVSPQQKLSTRTEDRISKLKYEMVIKGKTKELLIK